MIENLEDERKEVLEKMLQIAKNRKAKKSDRVSAARLFLNETAKIKKPDDEGAKRAKEILEVLK